jgi:hypothetical protein
VTGWALGAGTPVTTSGVTVAVDMSVLLLNPDLQV